MLTLDRQREEVARIIHAVTKAHVEGTLPVGMSLRTALSNALAERPECDPE